MGAYRFTAPAVHLINMKKKKPITIGKLKKKIETEAKRIAKERDGYICQKCKKKVSGSSAHGSHVIPVSRSQLLRFDPWNIKCLCYGCHFQYWHLNPTESGIWFRETFRDRFEYLDRLKNEKKHWKRFELEALYEELKQIDGRSQRLADPRDSYKRK